MKMLYAMLVARRIATRVRQRAAMLSTNTWKEKERAAEATYFNKEDERKMRRLHRKLQAQVETQDHASNMQHRKQDAQGLERILGLQLTPQQIDALIKWKHES